MNVTLVCHPDTPALCVTELSVRLDRGATDLFLSWELHGNMTGIAMPRSARPGRQDRLWRTTCFEAFVCPAGGEAYLELNASPSGAWASYLFDRCREGMRPAAAKPEGDDLFVMGDEGICEIAAGFDLQLDFAERVHRTWLLNVAAVIEDIEGRISYWALAHPPGKPDFHHPDCFVLELPPPARS